MACVVVFGVCAMAQSSGSGRNNSGNNSGGDKKTYPPGSAWTISWPLGTRIESTMDTVLYNYQRQFVTALNSDAWASTGQFSGPGINMIYFQRPEELPFRFNNSIYRWVPTFSKQKFYNVYIPYTQLSYNWGIGTENRTDYLKAIFAGNVNRKIGVGAFLEYPYTKGTYANQAAKELAFGISGYYKGDRYEAQAYFSHFNHLNKENGGITDDLYIRDPAELQGGVASIQPRSIPVNLESAHNRLIGADFYMSHDYKIGFWKDITQPEDTVKKEEYVPVTKFTYAFRYQDNHRFFIDDSQKDNMDFWKETYFNTARTEENNYYWNVSNSLGIQMIEGFQKWAKFGLMAYATWEIDKYRYEVLEPESPIEVSPGDESIEGDGDVSADGLTAKPEGWQDHLSQQRNRLWIGGRIEKTKGSILRYSADAKFGIVGEAAGEIDVRGDIETRFRLGKDTVVIAANGYFRNLTPNYMLNHYTGNHFIWNNDFGKIRSFRVEGHLHIPWTKTDIRVGVENVQNQVYFGADSRPVQYGGSVQVFSASLEQKLQFGIWNWNNTLTYQATSNKDVTPLPTFALYSNMFLYFKAFKALTVQIGLDCNYYTKYRGLDYQPATMSFHTQGENPVDVGGFLMSNVYLTAKLYKVRFFAMCSHVNQNLFSRDYFSLPHYPIDPRQFRVGLSIDFVN